MHAPNHARLASRPEPRVLRRRALTVALLHAFALVPPFAISAHAQSAPPRAGGGDADTSCRSTSPVGTNCTIFLVGPTASNNLDGTTPAPSVISHQLSGAQTLTAGGNNGAIDFRTIGGNGGNSDDHPPHGGLPNGGNGGNGGHIGSPDGSSRITVAPGVQLQGSNADGIVNLVSQGGEGADGHEARSADKVGTGGTGGAGGAIYVQMDGSIMSTDGMSQGLSAGSYGGGGGGGGKGSSGIWAAHAGRGGGSANVDIALGGTVAVAGRGVWAATVAGDGGTGPDDDSTETTAFASNGGAGGWSSTQSASVTIGAQGAVTSRTASAVEILARGGNGGQGGQAQYAVAVIGGAGGVGGQGGNAAGTVLGSVQGATQGLSVTSRGGEGGDGGDANGRLSNGSTQGGNGGIGGDAGHATAQVNAGGTAIGDSVAVQVVARGGDGGFGGEVAGSTVTGGTGGAGGNGGNAKVDLWGAVSNLTAGARASGGAASASGGNGGDGASAGGGSADAGNGGNGGKGGDATATLHQGGTVRTAGADDHKMDQVRPGLLAQANGGVGGNGGNASAPAGAKGGGSGYGGAGGTAAVVLDGAISTTGSYAVGAVAQSAGGLGAEAGGARALFLTHGGTAQNGGAGGRAVASGNGGTVTTTGVGALGVFVQSAGGGGGMAGNALGVGADILSIGGNGGAGGNGGTVIVGKVDADPSTSAFNSSIVTRGGSAPGLYAQSIGGAGGNGGNAVRASFAPFSLNIGGDSKSGGAGGNVTVYNEGQVTTFGDRSAGVGAQSVGGGGGRGGAGIGVSASNALSIGVSLGGQGGNGGSGGNVTLTNAQQVTTYGVDAYGIGAQSIAGGGGEGGTSTSLAAAFSSDPEIPSVALTVSVGGSGGVGGTAGPVTLNNNGFVATAGHGAYGVYAQSVAGGGGNGGDSSAASYARGEGPKIAIAVGAQGNGGASGTGGTVTVTNNALVTTLGESAHGVFAQSVGGGGGSGGAGDVSSDTTGSGEFGFSGSLVIGGKGGSGSQGGQVGVTNLASIATRNDGARAILAQSVGGGGGNAGGGVGKANGKDLSLAVSVGGSGGAGGHGGDVQVTNQATLLTLGSDADAIFAQSVGGGGGSAGKGSSTSGGSNSGAEVAESLAVTLANGLNIGKSVVQKGDKIFQIGDGVLKDVTAVNDLRGALGSAPGTALGSPLRAGADPQPDPSPDPKKDGEATNISVNVTIGGKGGAAGNGGGVTASNTGSIETDGARSNGVFAQSAGGGGGVGGLTTVSAGVNDKGGSFSVGGAGSAGGTGGQVDVTNAFGGTIVTRGAAAHGIYAQSVGLGGGKGGLTGSQDGALRNLNVVLGGSGGGGGVGGTVTVNQNGSVGTSGEYAFGIFAQSAGGGGGTADVLTDGKAGSPDNKLAIQLNMGGQGGVGGDGSEVLVLLDPGAEVTTYGTGAIGVAAQSVGGGGGAFITTSILDGRSIGLGGVTIPIAIGGAGGSSGNGGAVSVAGTAATFKTSGNDAIVVLAQSIGGGGGLVTGSATPGVDLKTLFASAQQVGNGGRVTVDLPNIVLASTGNGAVGILAQSLGGGGGLIGSMSRVDLAAAVQNTPVAEGGQGGNVTVAITNGTSIMTQGVRAHGIVAQSLGGGGGMVAQADGNGYAFSGATPYTNCSASACTGTVIVDLDDALVRATGKESYAILAQSRGNGVNGALVYVGATGSVQSWQDAAGAIFMSGADGNHVDNFGVVDDGSTTDNVNGRSKAGIAITGNQAITVTNGGTINGTQILDGSGGVGAVKASAGKGMLNNLAGGTVRAGGELRLGGGTMRNAGTLEIGSQGFAQTRLQGNLQQEASGKLVLDTDPLHQRSDLLIVDGDVHLAGTMAVRPTSMTPQPLKVVQASGRITVDGAVKIQDPGNGQLFGYRTGLDGQGGVTLAAYSKLGSAGVQQDLGARRGALAQHLDAGFNSAVTEQQSRVYTQLAALPTRSGVTQALDSLTGVAQQSAAITRLIGSLQFSERMNMARCDSHDIGELPKETDCTWARVLDGRTTRSSTADEAGFALDSAAVQGGFQRRIAPNWFLGAGFSYDNSSLRGRSVDQSVSGTGGTGGVVLKYESGDWLVAGSFDVGYGRYDSTRRIAFGSLNETAKASFGMWHAGLHSRIAYRVPLNGAYLRPYVDLHAVRLRTSAYRESGADALNLQVDQSSQNYATVSPMLELGGVHSLANGMQLRSFAAVGAAIHNNAHARAQARLQGWGNASGSPSYTSSSSVPNERAKVELGGTLAFRKNMELSVSYGGEFASGFRSHTAQLRYSYAFD